MIRAIGKTSLKTRKRRPPDRVASGDSWKYIAVDAHPYCVLGMSTFKKQLRPLVR